MKPSDKSRQMFLDMQEHPEHYSDEQLETMMDELDQVPDVDTAWQQLEVRGERKSKNLKIKKLKLTFNSQLRKIASVFIGLIIISGITIAAIHFWNLSSDSNPKSESSLPISPKGEETPFSKEREEDGLRADTIIFDNVPLDTMLQEIAAYYHVSLKFEREESRQLRFHFIWKHSESLDRVVERLNNFEAVNIVREPEKLIVR